MGGPKFIALLVAATAAVAATPWPAGAQCRLCDKPTTNREDPTGGDDIRLEIETSLNFDRLIVSGEGPGAALIRHDGSSASEGADADAAPHALVRRAIGRGQP